MKKIKFIALGIVGLLSLASCGYSSISIEEARTIYENNKKNQVSYKTVDVKISIDKYSVKSNDSTIESGIKFALELPLTSLGFASVKKGEYITTTESFSNEIHVLNDVRFALLIDDYAISKSGNSLLFSSTTIEEGDLTAKAKTELYFNEKNVITKNVSESYAKQTIGDKWAEATLNVVMTYTYKS